MGSPLLMVVSAPSGAGKTTLCGRLLDRHPDLRYSISCTTRPPRGREVDGVHYHFMDAAAFARHAAAGDFIEHAHVHGHAYGTLWSTVEGAAREGRSLLMDIDVQGAAHIRAGLRSARGRALGMRWTDVFIAPPSLEALRRRLEQRGEDTPAVIAARLKNAAVEMARAGEFEHVIVNDDLDAATAAFAAVFRGRREVQHGA